MMLKLNVVRCDSAIKLKLDGWPAFKCSSKTRWLGSHSKQQWQAEREREAARHGGGATIFFHIEVYECGGDICAGHPLPCTKRASSGSWELQK